MRQLPNRENRRNTALGVLIGCIFFCHYAEGQELKINPESSLPTEGQISEIQWGNYLLWGDFQERKLRMGVSNDTYTRAEIVLLNNNMGNGIIHFKTTMSDGGALTRMTLTPDGNVGIGTTNPSQKLDVNGTIRTKEINVTTAGWADYVFKPDYELKTLSEVERFIKDNGHLPNVPSEQEVLKNGVNLLEMNVNLLEKVEELTLYIIEMEARIKKMEENEK